MTASKILDEFPLLNTPKLPFMRFVYSPYSHVQEVIKVAYKMPLPKKQ